MSDRATYQEQFREIVAGLNTAQQAAVEQLDGPVLVVAGPGTGKTHILAARVGQILLETDTQPYNLLCLTFTEAGVRAMRERLLAFIGPAAHRVYIHTFHSFCNHVIQANPSLFGAHGLEPISELEQIELVQQLLDRLPIQHPLKRGRSDVYFYVRHLRELFQLMKREDWSVEQLHREIAAYLADLPARETFRYQVNRAPHRKGDLKVAKLADAQQRMERLHAAVALFPAYCEIMEQQRRYDYEDMILWVLRAFQTNEALLRNYQEQYLYIMVDEYQDTNGAQNGVLRQLINYWDAPNVFIVGDDDQSIYEFQGARLKNLRDFYTDYSELLQLIVLEDNYRSSQPILEAASQLIGQNEKRILHDLEGEKNLRAQHPLFKELTTLPQLVEYPNRLQETVDIVEQIEQLQQSKFPLDEVAIIYAQHQQAQDFVQLFEKKGIPYTIKRRVNILDLPLILNLRQLLDYIAKEYAHPYSGEHLLFPLLHADFLGIAPQDLALISQQIARNKTNERPTWRDLIRQPINLELQEAEVIRNFSDCLEQVIQDYRNCSVMVILERIINRTGILRFLLEQSDKAWHLQVLNSFFDFAREESERHPRLTLRQLLDTLDNMDRNRLRLAVNKQTIADAGVQLLTAHSAKGLEFQKVFLIDCIKDYWEPRKRSGNYQFTLPDTLTYSGEEDALEARRRLFYVGMTRAKELLHISYSRHNHKQKELQAAIFIDELRQHAGLHITEKSLADEQVLTAQTLLLLEHIKPQYTKLDPVFVNELLADFRLSISSLNAFLRCPLSFFYEYVLRVPTLMSEAASYGQAIHLAWQRLYEQMLLRRNKMLPPERRLLQFFEEAMQQLRPHFSEKPFQRRLAMGQQSLSYYYQQQLPNWTRRARVELSLKQVEVEGVPIKGTIDRVDYTSLTQAHIVDYKTGKVDPSKLRRPNERHPYGGNYYRQLAFYKVLFEHSGHTARHIASGEIIFIDPTADGSYHQERLELSVTDSQLITKLLRTTYASIQAHDFYTGCGESNCKWCSFLQRNTTHDSMTDLDIENLDDR